MFSLEPPCSSSFWPPVLWDNPNHQLLTQAGDASGLQEKENIGPGDTGTFVHGVRC